MAELLLLSRRSRCRLRIELKISERPCGSLQGFARPHASLVGSGTDIRPTAAMMETTMRRVIGGKVYDTEQAKRVCRFVSEFGPSDFEYEVTELYITARGAWFLAGWGGPYSRWAVEAGRNAWTSGRGLQPIAPPEAQSFLEQNGTAEEFELYFKVEEA